MKKILLILLLAPFLHAQSSVSMFDPNYEVNGNSWAWQANLSGIIFLVVSGSCPSFSNEVAALDGKMIQGTLAAHGDVGATGGSNSITPAGTNSTVNFTPVGTVAAPTFTGNSSTVVVNHTHTIASASLVEQAQGGTTASTTGTHVMTSTATGGSLRSVETTVAANKTTGNPDSGGAASYTPAGTNSAPTFTGTQGAVPAETFTGTAFDPHPAFVKVIFCAYK